LEINSSRVQNDVLNRIQESRDRLEVEIRKLLHEVSRIAEQALDRARKVKEEGTPAVQSAIERLNRLERDASALISLPDYGQPSLTTAGIGAPRTL
jgi:hypothetical protein